MTLFKLAIKNLLRKRVRSIAVILAAFLASGLLFSASAILKSVENSLELGMERLGADIMAVPAGYEAQVQRTLLAGEPSGLYMDGDNLDKVRAVSGVQKASPQLFMASAVLECCIAPNVLLVGYDPETDFTIRPWVRTSVPRADWAKDLDPVTIGANLGYLSSDDTRYYGRQFWIGSVLNSTGLGFLDMTVFMTMDTARRMIKVSKTKSKQPLNIGPDQISSILIKVEPGHDVHTVASDIEKSLAGITAIATNDLAAGARRNIGTALWGLMAAGLACWLMLLALLGLVFAMTVNERKRELALLRAMGATKLHVLRLILCEASLLTGFGAAAGVATGWGLITAFKELIIVSLGNIWFLWPSPLFIIATGLGCVLLMLLSGVFSALYPAIRTSVKEPYDAIRLGM